MQCLHLQDWISITYLLFYLIVYVVVIALAQEVTNPNMIISPFPVKLTAPVCSAVSASTKHTKHKE